MPAHARKPAREWTRTPEEEASYQAMLTKCKKWSEPSKIEVQVQPSTEGTGIVHEPEVEGILQGPQLRWRKISDYCITSACQTYQITQELIGAYQRNDGLVIREGVTKFQPWHRVQWLWYVRLGPMVETGDAARAACEAHLRQSA